MKTDKLRTMTMTGVFTALIFVFTAFIQIPSYNGYIHLGDALLYLAAAMLPLPYAMFAGAAGAVLADVITGYAIWAPASFVIKALTALCFSRKGSKIIGKRNLLGMIPAALLCVFGYYFYEVILYGSFYSAAYGLIGNVTQAVFSCALFVVAGLALDKAQVKEHMARILRLTK